MKPLTIAVCLKAVPDPKRSGEIRIDPVTRTLRRGDVPLVANPADRCALEQALRFKEEVGGVVKVISMGPPAAAEVLRQALAMGADEAHLLSDRAFAGADSLATVRTLWAGIRTKADFDLVITASESSDGGTSQVGSELALRVHARSDEVLRVTSRLPLGDGAIRVIDEVTRESRGAALLESARVVVAGGMGIGSAAGWRLVEELAAELGGAVGATRPPVDEGWTAEDGMIGQSGKTVRPDLYIGVGISGEIQHTVGIRDAKVTVAINRPVTKAQRKRKTDQVKNMMTRRDPVVGQSTGEAQRPRDPVWDRLPLFADLERSQG